MPTISDPWFTLPGGTFNRNDGIGGGFPASSPWTNGGTNYVGTITGGNASLPSQAMPAGAIPSAMWSLTENYGASNSSIEQAITFPAGTFNLFFWACTATSGGNQGAPPGGNTLLVEVDGVTVGTFTLTVGAGATNLSTSSFTVTAGSHTIKFVNSTSSAYISCNLVTGVSFTGPSGTSSLGGAARAVAAATSSLGGAATAAFQAAPTYGGAARANHSAKVTYSAKARATAHLTETLTGAARGIPTLPYGGAAHAALSASRHLGGAARAVTKATTHITGAARAGANFLIQLGGKARARVEASNHLGGAATAAASSDDLGGAARASLHGSSNLGGAARAVHSVQKTLYGAARAVIYAAITLTGAARASLPVFIPFGGAARSAPPPQPTKAAQRIVAVQSIKAPMGAVEVDLPWGGDFTLTANGDLLLAYDTLDGSAASIQRLSRMALNNPLRLDATGTPISSPDDIFHVDWGSGVRSRVGELYGDDLANAVVTDIRGQLARDSYIAQSPPPIVEVGLAADLVPGVDPQDRDRYAFIITVTTIVGQTITLPTFILK